MPSPGERFDRIENAAPYKPQSRALDPREVVIAPGWNVRDMSSTETREHINALKTSILTNGFDSSKPISVRYDRASGVATLVDGQCRLTACREIREEGTEIWIPCIIADGDEAQLTAASISGNAGLQLTQWEIGEGCRRLMRFGWTTEKIAASICKSSKYVTEAIALSNVSIEAKSMMAAGQVSPARVLQEVKHHGDAAVPRLKAAVEASSPAEGRTSKTKPLARVKAASSSEKALEAADKLVALILDDGIDIDEVTLAAKAYRKIRK